MRTITIIADIGVCTDCGKIKELRPYTADGRWVCFYCMKKDEATAQKVLHGMLDEGDVVIDARNNRNAMK